jgi:hypothetical protein
MVPRGPTEQGDVHRIKTTIFGSSIHGDIRWHGAGVTPEIREVLESATERFLNLQDDVVDGLAELSNRGA